MNQHEPLISPARPITAAELRALFPREHLPPCMATQKAIAGVVPGNNTPSRWKESGDK